MKTLPVIIMISAILLLLLECTGITHLTPSPLKNQEIEITIGEKYLYSFDWDEEDPFKAKEIDTVTVLEINGEYVKWSLAGYDPDFFLSGQVKFFKHNIRKL